ncbi:hypothetical protein [Geobacter sp.]|uniref:hypothetical protein n=1 Tax=Geobacter sp. TaxID=46610 RepID=UPI0026395E3D|nr:hypothetical protein [Geobacter sp.]
MKILFVLPANATLRVTPDQPAVPRRKIALLSFRLNMTYRYDNIQEGIVGRNHAALAAAIGTPSSFPLPVAGCSQGDVP